MTRITKMLLVLAALIAVMFLIEKEETQPDRNTDYYDYGNYNNAA